MTKLWKGGLRRMGGRGSSGSSKVAQAAAFAALKGTERQINYARDLRQKANNALDAGTKEAVKSMNPTPAMMRKFEENVNAAKKIINSETSASKLIDTLGMVRFQGRTESVFGAVISAARRLGGII